MFLMFLLYEDSYFFHVFSLICVAYPSYPSAPKWENTLEERENTLVHQLCKIVDVQEEWGDFYEFSFCS